MANHHLRNRELSLKAKGLLSLMLSLPEDWDYTTKGLSCICKDGVDSICATIKELEKAGYVKRRRLRDAQGRLSDLEYTILEKPAPLPSPPESPQRENPVVVKPDVVEPDVDNPELGKPHTENPAQLSIQEVNKQESILHAVGVINSYYLDLDSLSVKAPEQQVLSGFDGYDVVIPQEEAACYISICSEAALNSLVFTNASFVCQ